MSLIFKHRTRLGLTQQELAGRAGMGRSNIAKLERGELKPSATQLERLAAVFDVDVNALLPVFYPQRCNEEDDGDVEEELRRYKSENERLRSQNEQLRSENANLLTLLTQRPSSRAPNGRRNQDQEMVKDLMALIKMTHPDRHEGHPLALELTQALVALKAKYEARKTSL